MYICILRKAFQGSWGPLSSEKEKKGKRDFAIRFLKTRTRKSSKQSSGLMGLQSVQKIYIQTWYHKNIVFPQTWQNGAPIWGFSVFFGGVSAD